MKVYIFMLLFLFSCKEPNVFVQENYIISEVHYETIDKCTGIDIDDNMLVAAANHNGYLRYNILEDDNGNASLELEQHVEDLVSGDEGDAATGVLISDNMHGMVFIHDDYDPFLREDLNNPGVLYRTTTTCGNSFVIRDLALNNDIPDTTLLFTLQKHSDGAPSGGSNYSTSVAIREYFNDSNGIWEPDTEPACNTALHFSIDATKVSYFNNIVAVADAGLGVEIYKYERYIAEPFTDSNDNGVYDGVGCYGLNPELAWLCGEFVDEADCVEPCGTWVTEEDAEVFEDTNGDGVYTIIKNSFTFKDNFNVQGGEAESLFITDNYVLAGFDNDRGCYMALLDSDSSIMANLLFADGYSINAIDAGNSFLALAAGNDGVLIYQWDGSLEVNLLTNIDSGDDNYVYDVKVDGNNIYTASENGISIYKIEEQ
ncbi:MAG: hypothetical protein CMG25_04515 [Candidatus Marinimicrobia bacterium]|nr:hypothetical protein [Candidatus Neomarinimicrobiota bacterium]